MPTRLRFSEEVRVLGQELKYRVKAVDGPLVPKKNDRVRERPVFGSGSGRGLNKEQATAIYEYAYRQLDYGLMKEMLNDDGFTNRHLSLFEMEAFIGKALLSGDVKEVEVTFEHAKSISKFANIAVSNAYFEDLIRRNKRSYDEKIFETKYLLLITIIRQCDYHTLKFVLENITPALKLANEDMISRDGDMVFSRWARTREVAELTPEEKFSATISLPKIKIFDSFYEGETPLSAFLRCVGSKKGLRGRSRAVKKVSVSASQSEGSDSGTQEPGSKLSKRGKPNPLEDPELRTLALLLKHGADPTQQRNHAFKIAARFGLLRETIFMLDHMSELWKKKKDRNFKPIFVTLVAQAAVENQMNIISFVRSKVDRVKPVQTGAGNGGSIPRGKNLSDIVKEAIIYLENLGKHLTCTYRYKVLNGLFILLNMQKHLDAEEHGAQAIDLNGSRAAASPAKNNARNNSTQSGSNSGSRKQRNDSGVVRRPQTQQNESGLSALDAYLREANQKNNWKRIPGGLLTKNEVTDYNAAFYNLYQSSGNNSMTKGSSPSVPGVSVKAGRKPPKIGDMGTVNGSTVSLRGARAGSISSTTSLNTRIRRKFLLRPDVMYTWMINLLANNDFNGEKMGLVLMSFGLNHFIAGPRNKDLDDGVSDSGTWLLDPDDDDDEEGGLQKGGTYHSNRSNRSTNSNVKIRRRKSTFGAAMDMFRDLGNDLVGAFGTRTVLKQREKVLLLEKGAEFGSDKLMIELLLLIAPEFSLDLLKCVYIATVGDKVPSLRILLLRITDDFESVLNEAKEIQRQRIRDKKRSLGNSSGGKSKKNQSGKSLKTLFKGGKTKAESFTAILEEWGAQMTEFEQRRQKAADDMEGSSRDERNERVGTRGNARSLTRSISRGLNNIQEGIRKALKSKKPGDLRSKSLANSALLLDSKSVTPAKMSPSKRKGSKDAMNNQKAIAKGSNDPDSVGEEKDIVKELEQQYFYFLLAVLSLAMRYGHFSIASLVLENRHLDKKLVYKALFKKVREECSPKFRGKRSPREMSSLVDLLITIQPEVERTADEKEKELKPGELQRGCLHSAVMSPRLDNLRVVLEKISKHQGPLFDLADLVTVLKRSTHDKARDWDQWPNMVKLTFFYMKPKEKSRVEEVEADLKRDGFKMSPGVQRALNDIVNLSKSGDEDFAVILEAFNSGERRRSSLGSILGKASGVFSRNSKSLKRSLSGSFSSGGKKRA